MNVDEVQKLLALTSRRYTCLEILGNGSFGTVALCRDNAYKEEVRKAVKVVPAMYSNKKVVLQEVFNHRRLRHPHVIQFSKVLGFTGKIGIVMEHANHGTLFEYVKERHKLHESEARFFFQQLVIAVDYCHRKGIANRDIKLDNILLHREGVLPNVKLCDFGYSKNYENSLTKSLVGSPEYLAPEVLNCTQYDAKLVDVWCCGIALFVMLVGKYPFHVREENITREQRLSRMTVLICSLDYEIPSFVSASCRALLKKMLIMSSDRISIEQILLDPWFSKGLSQEALELNDKILAQDQEIMKKVDQIQSTKLISQIIEVSVV